MPCVFAKYSSCHLRQASKRLSTGHVQVPVVKRRRLPVSVRQRTAPTPGKDLGSLGPSKPSALEIRREALYRWPNLEAIT